MEQEMNTTHTDTDNEVLAMGEDTANIIDEMPDELKQEIEDKVKKLKEKHGIDHVEVFVAQKSGKDKDGYFITYFRKLRGVVELDRYVYKVQNGSPIVANYELAKSCYLDGDKEPLSDAGYTDTGLYMVSGKLVASAHAEIATF